MSTISIASYVNNAELLQQGDVFHSVKYSFIESEDSIGVNITEYVFPHAIIISQCCDTISASEMVNTKKGKATKFMPALLMCPIYNESKLKTATHLEDIFRMEDMSIAADNIYNSKDSAVASNDWHYRFHKLKIIHNSETIMDSALIDFKHCFTVPIQYLLNERKNRIARLENIYAEQLTLKFCTYLSRVAIPNTITNVDVCDT